MPLTITGSTTEFVTLDEVKDHLNVATDDNNAEIALVSAAAQDHVELLVGPVRWREVTDTMYGSYARRVMLSTFPVVSLGAVAYDGTPYTGATVEPVGVVRDLGGYGTLTVTYTAGRTVCPDDIRLATLIIAQHLWQTQLGNSPGRGALPGGEGTDTTFGVGFAIPSRAMDLLLPYLLPSGFA